MLRKLAVKAAPITNRVADYGPAAPVCCNACRACTTTNVVGLVFAAATAAGVGVTHLARRLVKSS